PPVHGNEYTELMEVSIKSRPCTDVRRRRKRAGRQPAQLPDPVRHRLVDQKSWTAVGRDIESSSLGVAARPNASQAFGKSFEIVSSDIDAWNQERIVRAVDGPVFARDTFVESCSLHGFHH